MRSENDEMVNLCDHEVSEEEGHGEDYESVEVRVSPDDEY